MPVNCLRRVIVVLLLGRSFQPQSYPRFSLALSLSLAVAVVVHFLECLVCAKVDVPYQYLKFFMEDDDELKRIGEK